MFSCLVCGKHIRGSSALHRHLKVHLRTGQLSSEVWERYNDYSYYDRCRMYRYEQAVRRLQCDGGAD